MIDQIFLLLNDLEKKIITELIKSFDDYLFNWAIKEMFVEELKSVAQFSLRLTLFFYNSYFVFPALSNGWMHFDVGIFVN